jgi:hypothetical protein
VVSATDEAGSGVLHGISDKAYQTTGKIIVDRSMGRDTTVSVRNPVDCPIENLARSDIINPEEFIMAKKIVQLLFLLVVSLVYVSEPATDNLAWGKPGPADTIVDRPGYAIGYIEYHEQPAWVIYKMTKEEATTKSSKANG